MAIFFDKLISRCMRIALCMFFIGICPTAAQEAGSKAASDDTQNSEPPDTKPDPRVVERDRLWKLAQALLMEGKTAEAVRAGESVLKIEREVLGDASAELSGTLDWLFNQYLSLQQLATAEEYADQGWKLSIKSNGVDHWQTASAKWRLDYIRKLKSAPAKSVHRMLLADKHFVQFFRNEEYAKAAAEARKLVPLESEILGEQHPFLGHTWTNITNCLKPQQKFAEAEISAGNALNIYLSELGLSHPDTSVAAWSLAEIHLQRNQHESALGPLKIAADARRAAGDIRLAALLDSWRGDSLHALERYAEAAVAWESALAAFRELNDVENQEMHLNQLAVVYAANKRTEDAEVLYRASLAILKDVLGESHSDYATVLGNLALVYESSADYLRAEQCWHEAMTRKWNLLQETSVIMSERQQLGMTQLLRGYLDGYISIALTSGQFLTKAARQVLRWKGATLVRQRAIRMAADEPIIAKRFRELQAVTRQLAALSRAPRDLDLKSWKKQTAELTIRKENLEAQLSEDSRIFRSVFEDVTPEQIRTALPSDAVLIDFLQFSQSRFEKDGAKRNYTNSLIAVVVRSKGDPLLVELGPITPLAEAVDTWRQTFGLTSEGHLAGLSIRQQIWEPLMEHISDAKTVLVSTDGVLGRLPLGALPGNKPGTYLLEDHRLTMIPVPQLLPELVNYANAKELNRELLLLGDVDYDSEGQTAPESKRRKRRPNQNRADLVETEFTSLPGAAGEVAAIQVLYTDIFEADSDDVKSLKRSAASEAAFRRLAGQFRHLHLATHGFFASADRASSLSEGAVRGATNRGLQTSRDPHVAGWNPGLLSGLALAGANLEPEPGKDDGILTAQEIAFLPLNGVDTVVLSACETGLGEVAGGEGLIGIQRAFQISGVRTTIASLWKVDDHVTRRLMERFYRNLWDKEMSRLDALREAQLYILNNPDTIRGATIAGKKTTKRVPPYYWAAFQLSGDWR